MMDGTMAGIGVLSRKGVLVATALHIRRFLHPIDADKLSAHTCSVSAVERCVSSGDSFGRCSGLRG